MAVEELIDLTRQAIWIGLLVGGPILLVGMAVGLVISLLQALTQIQDQTISFVPKIVAMVAATALVLPWALQQLMEFSESVIRQIPRLLGGG